jgi:hypothetical protein
VFVYFLHWMWGFNNVPSAQKCSFTFLPIFMKIVQLFRNMFWMICIAYRETICVVVKGCFVTWRERSAYNGDGEGILSVYPIFNSNLLGNRFWWKSVFLFWTEGFQTKFVFRYTVAPYVPINFTSWCVKLWKHKLQLLKKCARKIFAPKRQGVIGKIEY